MRPLWWAVIQSDWCPYKKKDGIWTHSETPVMCTQMKDHLRAQREGDPLQAVERGLRRNQPADILILDFQLPELYKKQISS